MEQILLQSENLCYSYGQGKQVLKDINITVKKGEKIVILGSNGAGKSTCFLNLNGVYRPDSGRILYRGKEIGKKDLNELRKNVGIVFQDADNQIIASTVFAEVSFGPMNLKLPKEEVKKRVEDALEYMNLGSMRDRPPHYLSGGEKKRVSIADIIAMESEVVIFDEPTASLDPVNVEMLEGVLDKMNEMGKTLLISTHDVDFAYRFADRAVIFSGGCIIADGPVREVFEDDEVLNQANLKRPILLEVYNSLVRHRILEEGGGSPRDARELEILLQTQRN
ncbi:energy-coupling factor ABC transporter ATP-binding protein [Lacrimispora sphenoides]|uniref:ABC transporter ATP-binding protein n=1 Tax=Lacrimispora sphenoides JCM 1415 TaxID=1297793 RepID=A0ABY1CF94_9FIRM|nr:ABC transporter ATP-binding protein [Lacrimispora sphenoides]SEU00467.1 cobalt/nickel transport system ATP-binding protein [[Clostridium] sphenoides JCM 1415]SUY53151.1 cobalt ABC transporter ATPase [Lacrimispora sphenoides]